MADTEKHSIIVSRKATEFKITWKQSTWPPTFNLWQSECSKGTERSRTACFTLTHSSSSDPNPTNLTRTSFNKLEILSIELRNRDHKIYWFIDSHIHDGQYHLITDLFVQKDFSLGACPFKIFIATTTY